MNISFVSILPNTDFIWALFYEQDVIPTFFPTTIQEFLKKHDSDQIREMFSEKNQFILVPLNENSKKRREEVGANFFKKISMQNESTLLLDCREFGESGLDFLVGFLLFSWSFDKYKTNEKNLNKNSIKEIIVLCNEPEKMKTHFSLINPAIQGVFLARSLTSEPPNVFFPEAYANHLKSLEDDGIQVEIINEVELKKIGMSALLAAGQGSIHSSAVAILTWNGLNDSNEKPIVIIGKGVCFDSGGLCLKSTLHQKDMKWDKAGGGVVAGFLKAIALAKMPCHVIGIIGLVENMPDGGAAKPGDVIKTMSGKTIEIVDTDAEGRLVLADCLWYAQKRFHPKLMIDLGTLTIETF
ncbi:MAG: hypothetical protein Q8K60_07610, partial [Parachlamydiaceae bacterium]|nr:hypothetical protein [Parachlamydiaceae bacterium]